MEFNDIQNVRDQVPVLVQNLKDRCNLSNFDIIQQLRLTLPAVVKFNLTNELESIKPALKAYVQKEQNCHQNNVPLHVYELIASFRKAFSTDELKCYSDILSARFDDDCNMCPDNDAFDLHSIIEMGKTLSRIYFRQSKFDAVDTVLNKTIDCIEKSDTDMPGLRAVGIYHDLVVEISHMGRKGVLERVNAILQKNAPNVCRGMGKSQSQISIPQDIIDKEFDSMSNGLTADETLSIFALKYVPTDDEIEKYSSHIKEQMGILQECTQMFFTTGNTLSHIVKPGSDNEEEQKDNLYSKALSYLTVAMHCIILCGQKRSVFNVDNVMNFIGQSTIMTSRRIAIIEKGVYAFMEYDYVTSMSILIPQIEFMVREFYAKNGFIVTNNDAIGTTSDALGTLLNNDDIVLFDKNITRYLRTILSNRTGWNLRNLYCHGIDDSFSILQADRIFHILILMAALTQKESGLADVHCHPNLNSDCHRKLNS